MRLGVFLPGTAESAWLGQAALSHAALMFCGCLGTVIGIAAAAAASRLLSGLLFGVSAHDPLTFVMLPAGLLLVALLASWIPARRALAVEPMTALRGE